jgi:hypothetical protein
MRSVGRTLIWSGIAALAICGLQAAPANAGATCKAVPSWCPPPPGGGGGDPSSVPEPATMTVLALGACAAAFAGRRRRK